MKKLTIKKFKNIKTIKKERQEIKEIPEEIRENHNNKIYFVSDMKNDKGYYYWLFRYEATPLKTQGFYYNDEENLFETLKNYDYLYLKDFDENISKKYQIMFKNGLKPNNFYKIEKENNKIKLIKIESEKK